MDTDSDSDSTSSSDSAMSGPAIEPLETLGDLLAFKKASLVAVETLRDVRRGDDPRAPRTLFCHDMMGGYLEDRFIHGCNKRDAYRFHHWQIINTFVYYSHHMVTISPPGWISAGHRHGVRVLGTFSLEGKPGLKTFNTIRGKELGQLVASQLARVAALYRFDGWLVSIGFEMAQSCVPSLRRFLSAIAEETHKAVPGSQVIWYDSVSRDGTLSPQSQLNTNNADFFNLCDGILLNFGWNEGTLKSSARYARDRKNDVYVGIDVFARDTQYEGGYETHKAVEAVRKHGLSSGIFAAGWVYETEDKAKFVENQCRLWRFPDHCCPEWRVTTLPLTSSFCQGFGDRVCKDGKVASSLPWFNLCKQQLQPRDQGTWPCGNGSATATVHTAKSFNGGGCLCLQFAPGDNPTEDKPYFRLFGCDVPLGSLSVSYTFDESPGPVVTSDVALVLTVSSAAAQSEQIVLGLLTTLPDKERYSATRQEDADPKVDSSSTIPSVEWITRKYEVRDLNDSPGATLKEVGVSFVSPKGRRCLLGQIVIDRPSDGNLGVKPEVDGDEDSEGPDDPALDMTTSNDEVSPTKRLRL